MSMIPSTTSFACRQAPRGSQRLIRYASGTATHRHTIVVIVQEMRLSQIAYWSVGERRTVRSYSHDV